MDKELTSRPLSEADLQPTKAAPSRAAQSKPAAGSTSSPKPAARQDRNSRPQRQRNNQGGGSGLERPRRSPQSNFSSGNFNQKSNGLSSNGQKAVKPAGVTKIDAGKLKIIPLGGLGEVGKNIMALEYENDIIVMDMGFTFPGEDLPGVDLVVPDATYLEERKHKVRGIVITHAHEDHVGGIPFILPKIPAPIYGAKFTAKFIERKLEEYRLGFTPQINTVDPDKCEKVQLGVFTVEFVRITHSIPDACLLVVHTPLGKIVNTGDWRFEPDPIDGRPTNMERLRQLGNENVLMLMCDSTN